MAPSYNFLQPEFELLVFAPFPFWFWLVHPGSVFINFHDVGHRRLRLLQNFCLWWEAICKKVLLVSPEAVNLKSEEGEMRRESLQILVAVRINPMLYSRSQ